MRRRRAGSRWCVRTGAATPPRAFHACDSTGRAKVRSRCGNTIPPHISNSRDGDRGMGHRHPERPFVSRRDFLRRSAVLGAAAAAGAMLAGGPFQGLVARQAFAASGRPTQLWLRTAAPRQTPPASPSGHRPSGLAMGRLNQTGRSPAFTRYRMNRLASHSGDLDRRRRKSPHALASH